MIKQHETAKNIARVKFLFRLIVNLRNKTHIKETESTAKQKNIVISKGYLI